MKTIKRPISYNEVKITERDTVKFGDKVFDDFISDKGGIELGTMIALAGTSGAGKTTLCKKWQADLQDGEVSVFFALESLKSSVAKQTKRIETGNSELICDEEDYSTWSEFMEYLYEDKPTMVIVDSLQHAAALMSKENGMHKYKNYEKIIKELYTWKDKTQGIAIIICQLNADGKMEGPAATIFNVDCPIFLTANSKTNEKFMETEKNRMGPTGKIFYEFVDTSACIKFYTKEEWEISNRGTSINEAINKTIDLFISSYSCHKDFKDFKEEFKPLYNKIYNDNNDNTTIITETIILINKLSEKYFKAE